MAPGAGCFTRTPISGGWRTDGWTYLGNLYRRRRLAVHACMGNITSIRWTRPFERSLPAHRRLGSFLHGLLVPHPNGKWLCHQSIHIARKLPERWRQQPYFDEVTAGFREGTTICAGSSIDMQILYDLFVITSKPLPCWPTKIPLFSR